MYQKQIPAINQSLARTGKAVVALGCSFVQGQGAVDTDMYDDYNWEFVQLGTPLQLRVNPQEVAEILARYKDLVSVKPDGELDFVMMEYKNAFVNVLCEKYFEGAYTPINLGRRGNGNRATIKDLYFYPEIDWHLAKEIVVVYCPSGMERFDFVNDEFSDHFHWTCIWPHPDKKAKGVKRVLWQGYLDYLYSEKFEVLENIAHVQELVTWCRLHDARLIITPSFDKRYDRSHMQSVLSQNIDRNSDSSMVHPPYFKEGSPAHEQAQKWLDLWPWENMYCPEGYQTWVELVVAQEKLPPERVNHFFEFLGKGSPDGWITSCAHPSAKGHDLFAQYLHRYITTGESSCQ